MPVTGVTEVDIDTAAVVRAVDDPRCGAVVTFAGVVRNHDHGREVSGIEYVGHPSAADALAVIVAELSDRPGVHHIIAQHRVGWLDIGGMALFVAVAAEHRDQGFSCASDLVDLVKQRVPIWKRQVFTDGTFEWSQCP